MNTSGSVLCILFYIFDFTTGFLLNWSSSQNNVVESPFSQMSTRWTRQQSQDRGNAETRRCFGELGCVEITPEFRDPLHRPFNLLPFNREKVRTRFSFYHRNRTVDPVLVHLDNEELLDAGFDPVKPIKIIVHGFLDNGFGVWVVKLAQSLLLAGDFNVFAVDWGGGALSTYTRATANTRLVALEIAHYIKFLEREFGVKREDIHCIGHSLGAHTCGYTGQNVPGLGRITGLDPAEPYFQYLPEVVRLSPNDAQFVDVVHSDGRTILLLGLGVIQPCGHMDFFVNSGQDQPGCGVAEIAKNLDRSHGYEELIRDVFACNHHRAVYYWTEAVINRCQLVGHICENHQSYLRGDCGSCAEDGSNCALLGLDADKFQIGNRKFVPFYLSTANQAPFCVRHYKVIVQLGSAGGGGWVTGKLRLSVIGSRTSINDINLHGNDNLRLQHGTTMSFVVQNAKELGVVQRVKVHWKSSCSFSWCNSNLVVSRIQVVDIDHMTPMKLEAASATLCADEDQKFVTISSGSAAKLDRRC